MQIATLNISPHEITEVLFSAKKKTKTKTKKKVDAKDMSR